jgi:hypothetical protein
VPWGPRPSQAIFFPSGDQAGSQSGTEFRVNRRNPLPSALITKISFPQ